MLTKVGSIAVAMAIANTGSTSGARIASTKFCRLERLRFFLLTVTLLAVMGLSPPSHAWEGVLVLQEAPVDEAMETLRSIFLRPTLHDAKIHTGHELLLNRFAVHRLSGVSQCREEYCPVAIVDWVNKKKVIKFNASNRVRLRNYFVDAAHYFLVVIFETPCGTLDVFLNNTSTPAFALYGPPQLILTPLEDDAC